MSVTIQSNYSQFYKGSEAIKPQGSGNGVKDTNVRNEFNTTDVIVEFSGDGLAALEAHKGMFPEEHKEIPEGMITELEGPKQLTEEELSAAKGRNGTEVEAQMRVTSETIR